MKASRVKRKRRKLKPPAFDHRGALPAGQSPAGNADPRMSSFGEEPPSRGRAMLDRLERGIALAQQHGLDEEGVEHLRRGLQFLKEIPPEELEAYMAENIE